MVQGPLVIPGGYHLLRPYLVAKLLQFTVVGILCQKLVDMVQSPLVIPGGYHPIDLHLVAKLLQFPIVGILG